MLSIVASMVPFSDCNPSPRNMYQCQVLYPHMKGLLKMGKQTMGFPVHAYSHRSDNKLYCLHTPQVDHMRTVM